MEDRKTIELRPSAATFVVACGVLAVLMVVSFFFGLGNLPRSNTHDWSVGRILLAAAPPMLVLVAGGYVVLALTTPQTLTLDHHGIQFKARNAVNFMPWSEIERIVLRRSHTAGSFSGSGTYYPSGSSLSVVIERRNKPDWQVGNSYMIDPKELFGLMEYYSNALSIQVRMENIC